MYDEDLLIRGAKKMGIELTQPQIEKFGLYYHLLVEWNKTLNLTRITEGERIITDHFLDSLTPVNYLDIDPKVHFLRCRNRGRLPWHPIKNYFPPGQANFNRFQKKKNIFFKKSY